MHLLNAHLLLLADPRRGLASQINFPNPLRLNSATTARTPSQGMNDVELVTADDPPTRHLVPRSRLCTLSRTFEDLLSLPTCTGGEESNEIILTETYKEMELFIKLLKGEDPGDEYSGSYLQDEQKEARRGRWIGLARMADKYDCPYAATLVKSAIW